MIPQRHNKRSIVIVALILYFFASSSIANTTYFYIAPSMGYASTDWSFLTTPECMGTFSDGSCYPNPAAASAPIDADDTGLNWGILIGYRFSNNFALEANYYHFADSEVTLGKYNVEIPKYDLGDGTENVSFTSATEAWALQTKFFLPERFLDVDIDFFSTLGIELTHRSDVLADTTQIGGVFGAGLSYDINKRLTTQLYFNYYTGYGASSVYPCEDYVPFIYQINTALLIKV